MIYILPVQAGGFSKPGGHLSLIETTENKEFDQKN